MEKKVAFFKSSRGTIIQVNSYGGEPTIPDGFSADEFIDPMAVPPGVYPEISQIGSIPDAAESLSSILDYRTQLKEKIEHLEREEENIRAAILTRMSKEGFNLDYRTQLKEKIEYLEREEENIRAAILTRMSKEGFDNIVCGGLLFSLPQNEDSFCVDVKKVTII